MKFFMLFCYQWNYVFLLIKELSGTLEVEIDGAFELFFLFFCLRFTTCKAEQPGRGMKKKRNKIKVYMKSV